MPVTPVHQFSYKMVAAGRGEIGGGGGGGGLMGSMELQSPPCFLGSEPRFALIKL